MADGGVTIPGGQAGFFQGARLRSSFFDDSDARPRGIFVRGSDRRPAVVKDVGKELALAGMNLSTDEDEEQAQMCLQHQRKMERYRKEHKVDLLLELQDRLLDFDPKQGGEYYTRMWNVNLTKFNLDDESPLGPMRFTDAVYKDKHDYKLCGGVNIFSVKMGCSDVGFPIRVYGTIIARDSIDGKCIHLFNRDRDHCQIINSEDESLVLTGPKRGLALIGNNYIETNLKILGHQGQDDREFSKGLLTIWGISGRSLEKCEVESISLATRLSTVDVTYGFVANAVEGTIAIEVTQGHFDGQITAHTTTSIENKIVLYDRELYGAMSSDGEGVIQLMRPVVSVSVNEMLVIIAKTRDGKPESLIEFTPRVNGGDEDVITVGGDVRMHVKVTWSIMKF